METLSKEPERVKEYVRERTEKFVNDPHVALDQKLLPGSNVNGFMMKLGSESHSVVPIVTQKTGCAVISGIAEIGQREPDEEKQSVALAKKKPAVDEQKMPKISDRTKQEEVRFIQELKEYEATAKDKYKTGINVNEVHSMDEIWEILDTFSEECQRDDTKGVWGKIRLAFRKLGEHGKAVTGWLGLIPSENNYLSVLSGGLKMILKAAVRMKEVADEVFEALFQIPLILSGAQRVLVVYRDSKKLETCSSALYISILETLGLVLSYLREKSISGSLKRAFKALVQQSNFGDDVEEKIKAMTKSRDNFNAEADICQKEMIKELHNLTETGRDATKDVQTRINAMAKALETARLEKERTANEIGNRLKAIEEKASELRDEMAAVKNVMVGIESLFKASPKVLAEAIVNRLQLDAPALNLPMHFGVLPKTASRDISPRQKKSKKQEYSKRELRDIIISRLHYDEKRAREDIEANYAIAATLSREDQQRCICVVQSSALGSWVTSIQSMPFVVHGNSAKPRRRSPMSFVCAKLVYTLSVMKSTNTGANEGDIFPLHFFCGEHADRGEWDSPVGVANSLFGQLVNQCRSRNLTELIKLGDFNKTDMKAVCERFESVLANLPKTAIIFCIVDALSFYVDGERVDETEALIGWLIRLSRGQYNGSRGGNACIFKLLLTAPYRLHGSALEELADDEVVTLPMKLPHGGGFNEMKWELGLGSKLDGLT